MIYTLQSRNESSLKLVNFCTRDKLRSHYRGDVTDANKFVRIMNIRRFFSEMLGLVITKKPKFI